MGQEIAKACYLRGAEVYLIQGNSGHCPPSFLSYAIADTYEDYQRLVLQCLSEKDYRFGIFSAAVADYRPETVYSGKIPSGERDLTFSLVADR